MTKRHEIIKVGDYLYAVDNKCEEGDWCVGRGKKDYLTRYVEKAFTADARFKIVMTNDPAGKTFKGVLQLPEELPSWTPEFDKKWQEIDEEEKESIEEIDALTWFCEGYKAARGQYSEEAMRAAYKAGAEYGKDYPEQIDHILPTLKSLSKVPIAIEVEMEEKLTLDETPEGEGWINTDWSQGASLWIRIKNNNGVVVGRYIYE